MTTAEMWMMSRMRRDVARMADAFQRWSGVPVGRVWSARWSVVWVVGFGVWGLWWWYGPSMPRIRAWIEFGGVLGVRVFRSGVWGGILVGVDCCGGNEELVA